MSTTRHHADWLSLVEVSGPFVSLPVLMRAFPQGLDPRDPIQAKALRAAHEEWQDNPAAPSKQRAWAMHVLTAVLGYSDNLIAEGQTLPAGLQANMPEMGETLRPDFALLGPAGTPTAGQAQLLINGYPAEQALVKPVIGKHWKATPATRMMELLHGANVPLGLVTNGEHWMLVYAPRGETTGYASWYSELWLDEPITLRAFHSLLGVRRFFAVAADNTLLALLKESASDQQEVTDQLGYQVREAVEVLVQAFDALHQESQGTALKGLEPATVYDAALTIMMRLVFLFSAEERGLLHLGKPLYDDNYAVSTLQEQLQEVADRYGEEVLERRYDTWSRLLATFRAVHGGIRHQDLLMQAYGGSLFDPDRYPFLEGRARGSHWRNVPAEPLAVNNRVVLHLLNSLQRLRTKTGNVTETRRVSFRALGVEQIGHVYEGLLDHTAVQATKVVLGIRGTRKKEPEIALSTLEDLLRQGEDKLLDFLKEETGRSLPALRRELNNAGFSEHKLLVACHHDEALLARLRPFAGLIREDSFERPWVVLSGSIYVTDGTARRSTGTHYTPPSLTEPIVQHTLEPLVYVGPAEGLPKEQWRLKTSKEILDLKVCDMAMGSGAFLVQACRYLAERLVEAWENEEKAHPGQVLITPDGKFSEGSPSERLVPAEAAERIAIARRVVTDRCLYGVDINPMAVEMAKLSMWLITVDANRPFTFLDHAFKCGDSLLGITSMEQLENFSLRPGGGKQQAFATLNLWRHIEEATKKREMLEAMPSDTPEQITMKTVLNAKAEEAVAKLNAAADVLVAIELKGLNGRTYEIERETSADQMMACWEKGLAFLREYATQRVDGQRYLHWAISFPEVMNKGFHVFIGNPPFLGGRRIIRTLGERYQRSLLLAYPRVSANVDLCAYFSLRAFSLLMQSGFLGFITTKTISEGDTRESCLVFIESSGGTIYRAMPGMKWPGTANVQITVLHISKSKWSGIRQLIDSNVDCISTFLTAEMANQEVHELSRRRGEVFQGCAVAGDGFLISEEEAHDLIKAHSINCEVIQRYLSGQAFCSDFLLRPNGWIINFHDKSEEDASRYSECLSIIRERVKPYRDTVRRDAHRKYWWKFGDKRPALYSRIEGMPRIIANARVAKHLAFAFLPADICFLNTLHVFPFSDYGHFSILQSNIHAAWALSRASSVGGTTQYTPVDCFMTFPFPMSVEGGNMSHELEKTGKKYENLRTRFMQEKESSLTVTYNKFHDPDEIISEIIELHHLQIAMDLAVGAAYGWQDIDLGHGFHETKQGIRFTISEAARREVLDRLLALNHQRYAEEVAAGLHAKKSPKAPKQAAVAANAAQTDLFSKPAQTGVPERSPIVDYLTTHPGWHSKDVILSATGFPENRWNVSIRELLDSGQVERQGERRGARYQVKSKTAFLEQTE
jgi:hypothetical protein